MQVAIGLYEKVKRLFNFFFSRQNLFLENLLWSDYGMNMFPKISCCKIIWKIIVPELLSRHDLQKYNTFSEK